MARRIIAIAALTLRAAARSRAVASIVLVTLAILALLPAILRGDGTTAGNLQLLLNYTLGAALFAAGVTTLWLSSAAISTDIENRRLWLVVTKPLSPIELWLGRWTGLCVLNALLVLLAGGTAALFARSLSDGGMPETRRETPEVPRDESAEAEARLSAYASAGKIPPDMSRAEALGIIARRIHSERCVVAPGSGRDWSFLLPADLQPGRGVDIRVYLAPVIGTENPPLTGWTIYAPSGPGLHVTPAPGSDGSLSFEVPAALCKPRQPLILKYSNARAEGLRTVVFDPARGAQALTGYGGFTANLARSLIILFGRLCIITAVGLTAGTLFSFPVAVFCAAALVCALLMGQALADGGPGGFPLSADDAGGAGMTLVHHLTGAVAQGIEAMSRPILSGQILPRLAGCILVPWAEVAVSGVITPAGLALALALLSAVVLRRRDIARANA